MQVDLSGLRALVTGFTKGIGFAVAERLAANGAEVVINGRKAADVEAAAMFRSMGQSAADPKAQRDFIDKARPSSIIKRLERPEEIAEVVTFLVSREAGANSGSPVRADGGVVMGIT